MAGQNRFHWKEAARARRLGVFRPFPLLPADHPEAAGRSLLCAFVRASFSGARFDEPLAGPIENFRDAQSMKSRRRKASLDEGKAHANESACKSGLSLCVCTWQTTNTLFVTAEHTEEFTGV